MIITKSNILLGRTPTVSTGENNSFDVESIVDPDFSTFYSSSDNSRLTIDFGSTGLINYVAFAGSNISGNEDFQSRFSVLDGSIAIARTFIKYDNCCVVTFEPRTFSNLRAGLFNSKGNTPPQIRFIAAGNAFTVPNNGEVSGYNRNFLNRSIKSKATLNDIAAPINYLTKKVSASGRLSLPNMTKDFSENEWQDFLNFAVSNHFFIREQDPVGFFFQGGTEFRSDNNSAYLCYQPSGMRATAHEATRSLDNLALSFKVFSGL